MTDSVFPKTTCVTSTLRTALTIPTSGQQTAKTAQLWRGLTSTSCVRTLEAILTPASYPASTLVMGSGIVTTGEMNSPITAEDVSKKGGTSVTTIKRATRLIGGAWGIK